MSSGFSATKMARKGVQTGAVAGGSTFAVVLAAVGLFRALGVELWSPEEDAARASEIAGAIAALVGAVGTLSALVGMFVNWLKNRRRGDEPPFDYGPRDTGA